MSQCVYKVEVVEISGDATKKIHVTMRFAKLDEAANAAIVRAVHEARAIEFALSGREAVMVNVWPQWHQVHQQGERVFEQRFGRLLTRG